MKSTLAVILPAAGSSSRYGKDKLLENLAGKTVLTRSIEAFIWRDDVAQVIIPTAANAPLMQKNTALPADLRHIISHPKIMFAVGGGNRAQSVLNALRLADPDIPWAAVHDAARPLLSQNLITRTFQAARRHGAAVPAMPVTLTIKEADGPLPAQVLRTVPRQRLWAMQTPQIAGRQALLDAYAKCHIPLENVTDDMQLIELAGEQVWLVNGEEQNLKLTTPMDKLLAELWCKQS